MTAPDPGLTDLIAAHWYNTSTCMCTCGWSTRHLPESDVDTRIGILVARHLASVVEQHTNGRITELEAELEKQKRGGRTLGKTIDRTLKDVVAAVGAEDMIDEDGDGDYAAVFEKLFELRPARDAAIARAEKAEATIARVRDALTIGPLHRLNFPKYKDPYAIDRHVIRAALEGEQQ